MYQLNLIDTPGHVDFSYEVSRSLQACEGALLVVDASQGVEAQTLANTYLALHHNLEIIPVINKIDLPAAEPERIREQIETSDRPGCQRRRSGAAPSRASASTRFWKRSCTCVPPPKGSPDAPLRALIFDSWFDPYRGVIILTRVIDGRMRMGQKIRLWSNGQIVRSGGPRLSVAQGDPVRRTAGRRSRLPLRQHQDRVATPRSATPSPITSNPAAEPLPGFEEIKPMVFAGLYPVESHEHGLLRDALEKLRLNDSAFNFEPENSVALGFGFRCGFLGLLHLEIVQERLEREFNIDLITTAPGVRYRITANCRRSDRGRQSDQIPRSHPRSSRSKSRSSTPRVITREEYLGGILKLLEEKRGTQKKFEYIGGGRVMLVYELPLNEIVLDFYDRLKSRVARLRFARLSPGRLSRLADGEAGRAGGGRAGGCAVA